MINPNWAFCICDFETNGIDDDSLPIEIGCIWTDSNFRTIQIYDTFVHWPSLQSRKPANWTKNEMIPYRIHKIEYSDYADKTNAVSSKQAANDVSLINEELLKIYDRVILISDNAKFETEHMKKIFDSNKQKWNFHYCTHDTSLLLDAVGVGDPEAIHRALPDAALLQVAIIQAMDRVRHIS